MDINALSYSRLFTLLAALAQSQYENLLQVNEILERNGIKIPTTGGGVWGGTKRRKSENFAEARSVKIKTEAGESANKSLSRIHQCK